MPASEKAVAAVMKALGCDAIQTRDHATGEWDAHCEACGASWTEIGCALAVAAADAAVDTDRPSIQAQALREAAEALVEATEGSDRCGTKGWSERNRDVYSLAIVESREALTARADRIEAQS